jgi:hypothetical protein
MKYFHKLFACGGILCASIFSFSCKKQFTEPTAVQPEISSQAGNGSQCKPAVFGAYASEWITLAQKWYVNGKVKYLKAKHAGYTGTVLDPFGESFDLAWGEVSYEGNQVYLKDVLNNRLLMRVTLDDLGRPVATYYDNEAAADNFVRDTTYYYYNANGLDYMISLFVTTVDAPTPYHGYRKFLFSYDTWGNVVKAEIPQSMRLNIQYDYTKPVVGIIDNFQLTSSVKLLQYMELINWPMHHAIVRTSFEVGYANYYSEIFHSDYKDYIISNGLVQSYREPNRAVTFYNAWDCGLSNSLSAPAKPANGIFTLKQFQEVYSNGH